MTSAMTSELRVISLLPGATETVAALGASDCLVGRSHECDFPPTVRVLPACTRARLDAEGDSAAIDAEVQALVRSALSIYDIDIEQVARLQPTHILTQDQCDVCAVSFGDLQAALAQVTGLRPQVISMAGGTLADVWADIDQVAQALGIDAGPVLAGLRDRLAAVTAKVQAVAKPTVAAIEWIEPLMAGGNWIPELIERAGGVPAISAAGGKSPYIEWEQVRSLDPDAIVIMPCGFDLERTQQESRPLARKPGWSDLKAVQTGQVYATDGNAYFNRPGPRLVDSVEILAEILHPELFGDHHRARGWEPLQVTASV